MEKSKKEMLLESRSLLLSILKSLERTMFVKRMKGGLKVFMFDKM